MKGTAANRGEKVSFHKGGVFLKGGTPRRHGGDRRVKDGIVETRKKRVSRAAKGTG